MSAAKPGTLRTTSLIAVLVTGVGGSVALDAGFFAARALERLTGPQIHARFVGMELTDEVYYRLVYERDGTLRSMSAGAKTRGRWAIEKDQLCLYLQETDDGCYDVAQSGETFVLTPTGLGLPVEGILRPIPDSQ